MPDNPRIEELRRRVQLDPASIAFAALAEEYRRGGRFEEAIATCEAGLQRHPAYLSARVTLGRALLEMGRFADARVELEHVLRIAPENLAAIRALAEIHSRQREYGGDEQMDAPVEPEPEPEPAAQAAPVAPVPTSAPVPLSAVSAETHSALEATESPVVVPPPAAMPADVHRPVPVPAAAAKPATPQPDAAALELERFLTGVQRVRRTIPERV